MNIQVLRVWKHEQVDEYLREALLLVEEIAPPDDLRAVVFTAAVQLCSQTVTAAPNEVPVDLAALMGRKNHDPRG